MTDFFLSFIFLAIVFGIFQFVAFANQMLVLCVAIMEYLEKIDKKLMP